METYKESDFKEVGLNYQKENIINALIFCRKVMLMVANY